MCAENVAKKPTLHLIGSAHLDPVWLWDRAEGMNEGIATCRTMVDLLREFPDFRFIRGEAAVYAHIERHAPALFRDIKALIEEGRWDVVGGNWIQPDTNLPSSAALLRQFLRGKEYFREKFGVTVRAAWAADSFGHSAGLPEILAAAGLDSFAFTRPTQAVLPLRRQAFWWRGSGGARILAYRPFDGWYASNRDDLGARLDACLERAAVEGLENVALFYGLGNHGGGPSRRHLREIAAWAARHPGVEVKHSGLHLLFQALRDEVGRRGEDLLDTHEGELNFCLRGCSASVAKFKYAYRRAEAGLLRAERTVATLGGVLALPQDPLEKAWDRLLFNSFHDILPGSAIERAYEEQLSEIGAVANAALDASVRSLTDLAAGIDTTAGAWPVGEDESRPQPILVWNPHAHPVRALVELETKLDYRPMVLSAEEKVRAPLALVEAESGASLGFQVVEEENDSLHDYLWRRRIVAPVELPALGWTLLQFGLNRAASASEAPKSPVATTPYSIANGSIGVLAQAGSCAVALSRNGRPWLGDGLQFRLYDDTWGSWGGMREERESWELTEELERLKISDMRLLERGPWRAALWVRFAGAGCRVDVTFLLGGEAGHVELRIRAFLDRCGARLKLVVPGGGPTEFEVPGGTVRRPPCGEVPGGAWARGASAAGAFGFASDALYGFDSTDSEFRATIARSSRYASDVRRAAEDLPWRPCADIGEHIFRAVLTPDEDALPRLAEELRDPPRALSVPACRPKVPLPVAASLLSVSEQALSVLAIRALSADLLELHVQNRGAVPLRPEATFVEIRGLGRLAIPETLPPGKILVWRLQLRGRAGRGLA